MGKKKMEDANKIPDSDVEKDAFGFLGKRIYLVPMHVCALDYDCSFEVRVRANSLKDALENAKRISLRSPENEALSLLTADQFTTLLIQRGSDKCTLSTSLKERDGVQNVKADYIGPLLNIDDSRPVTYEDGSIPSTATENMNAAVDSARWEEEDPIERVDMQGCIGRALWMLPASFAVYTASAALPVKFRFMLRAAGDDIESAKSAIDGVVNLTSLLGPNADPSDMTTSEIVDALIHRGDVMQVEYDDSPGHIPSSVFVSENYLSRSFRCHYEYDTFGNQGAHLFDVPMKLKFKLELDDDATVAEFRLRIAAHNAADARVYASRISYDDLFDGGRVDTSGADEAIASIRAIPGQFGKVYLREAQPGEEIDDYRLKYDTKRITVKSGSRYVEDSFGNVGKHLYSVPMRFSSSGYRVRFYISLAADDNAHAFSEANDLDLSDIIREELLVECGNRREVRDLIFHQNCVNEVYDVIEREEAEPLRTDIYELSQITCLDMD